MTRAYDGRLFDRAWLLRSGGEDLQRQLHEARCKRAGFSYAELNAGPRGGAGRGAAEMTDANERSHRARHTMRDAASR